MIDWLDRMAASGFMPHGHCYLWDPTMVAAQVASNLAIGIAYLSISLTLVHLVRRIRDLPFQWVYVAFGVFIVTCGLTHFMDVWVIWRPDYWADVAIRIVTAVASVGTALMLFPLFPQAVALAEAARTAHEQGLRIAQLNTELQALYEGTRETLAESLPLLVWTNTPDGAVDYVNRRWIEYAGPGRYAGRGWAAIVHADDLPELDRRFQASLATGDAYEVVVRLRGKDGTYRWFISQALPLRDAEGRIVKWFGTCTDIHDRKLASEERDLLLKRTQEAVRTRDVFLAIAAHELRTPLTPLRLEIDGLLKAVLSGSEARLAPERVGKRLSLVSRQVGRLETLVELLLDVSRIAGGKLEIMIGEVNLAELVGEVTEQQAAAAAKAGSTIELRVAKEACAAIGEWDRPRLQQVLGNLLANAILFGAGKPIAVELDADDRFVRLRVVDHGIGIAPEDQARIFEPFERAVSERYYGGLGLGLWIVRQIVEAHGGTVRVASALGEGSTFTVELPRAKSSPVHG